MSDKLRDINELKTIYGKKENQMMKNVPVLNPQVLVAKAGSEVVGAAAGSVTQYLNNRENLKHQTRVAEIRANAEMVGKAMDLAQSLASAAASVYAVGQQEQTKRDMIDAVRQNNLAKIETQKQFLRDYLEKTFDERENNFNKLFEVLDKGLESGNMELVQSSLKHIVTIAESTPLKMDAVQVLTALEDEKITDFKF